MSFEVICIKDDWRPSPMEQGKPHPSFGEYCNVIEVKEGLGREWYVLDGYCDKSLFLASNFSKTSNLDERDRLEAYQQEQSEVARIDRMPQGLAEHMPEVEMEPGAFERVWQGVVKKAEGWV